MGRYRGSGGNLSFWLVVFAAVVLVAVAVGGCASTGSGGSVDDALARVLASFRVEYGVGDGSLGSSSHPDRADSESSWVAGSIAPLVWLEPPTLPPEIIVEIPDDWGPSAELGGTGAEQGRNGSGTPSSSVVLGPGETYGPPDPGEPGEEPGGNRADRSRAKARPREGSGDGGSGLLGVILGAAFQFVAGDPVGAAAALVAGGAAVRYGPKAGRAIRAQAKKVVRRAREKRGDGRGGSGPPPHAG